MYAEDVKPTEKWELKKERRTLRDINKKRRTIKLGKFYREIDKKEKHRINTHVVKLFIEERCYTNVSKIRQKCRETIQTEGVMRIQQ